MSEIIVKKTSKELWLWRIVLILILVFYINGRLADRKQEIKEECVVKTKLHGEIFFDDALLSKIEELKDNNNVKGVLLQIDSPGGSITGSESIYRALKDLSSQKPLVVSVQNAAASGGYMVAMAANDIVAYESSVVGSIGVIAESFEITELAEKVGIKLLNYKSSPLKGIPSIFEKPTVDGNASIQLLINGMQSIFMGMVQESRPKIKQTDIEKICDGRAYTGKQGLENGLIDAIGSENEAFNILKTKHNIKEDIRITNFELMAQMDNKSGIWGLMDSFFSIIQSVTKIVNSLKTN